MSTQFIEKNGETEYAVLPIATYHELIEKAEQYEELAAFDKVVAALGANEDESVPESVVDALLGGSSPVKVWREFRGLSQAALGDKAGLSQAYIAQIETGKREGRVDAYKAIAEALKVDLEDLV